MKLEPMRHQESTAQLFGKRYISWQGMGVSYREKAEEEEEKKLREADRLQLKKSKEIE